jgi:ubiquinone/menaquinone biosynthesis C-methylase UbiE
MECYNEFADIYDKLIHGDVDYKLWSEKIINICQEVNLNQKDYLDLACGTGNLTVHVGKKFVSTTAVDLSQYMLTKAEEKLRNQRIRAKIMCQNMCDFNLRKTFDLITCALDSTNYILEKEELISYFKCVYNHLKEDGIFIFDINSEYKLLNILGNNVYNYDSEEVVYIWENVIEEEILNMYLTFFVKEGQVYKRFDEQHKERIYSEQYIDGILHSVGFEIMKKLDNYESTEIKKETERIVYVLGKRK